MTNMLLNGDYAYLHMGEEQSIILDEYTRLLKNIAPLYQFFQWKSNKKNNELERDLNQDKLRWTNKKQ